MIPYSARCSGQPRKCRSRGEVGDSETRSRSTTRSNCISCTEKENLPLNQRLDTEESGSTRKDVIYQPVYTIQLSSNRQIIKRKENGEKSWFFKKRRGRPSEALISPSLKSKTEKGIIVRIIIQADSSFVRPLRLR